MNWRGRTNFVALLERAKYTADKEGLDRLVQSLGRHLDKPPTVGSIRTACLSPQATGYKKPPVNQALCLVLGCVESDLYDVHPRAQVQASVSTWDRLRAGVDVADRLTWPI